jgi:hypothetical protein
VWLEKDAPLCPQLYLYSGADDLIPDADVERHMQRQEERVRAFASRRPHTASSNRGCLAAVGCSKAGVPVV